MASEMEWRRRWKPNLRSQPWKPLSDVGGENFLVKSNFKDDSYELLVTDTITLWHEEVDNDQVKERTQRLNPSVEAPVTKLLDHLRDSLDVAGTNIKAVSLSASFKSLADSDDQKLLLTMNTKLAGLPFVWKFSALPTDSVMVSDHLTVPLLTIVGELSRRQHELHKLLRNKDKEIDDLKGQGVKVTRKHLETVPFDEATFKTTMTGSKGCTQLMKGDCTKVFDTNGQELYQELMTKHAYIYRPERQDDDEDDSQDEGGAAGGATGPSWTSRLPASLASGTTSPKKTPTKSPAKSPGRSSASPTKDQDLELQRRQELELRLEQEEERRLQKKKKKKMKF